MRTTTLAVLLGSIAAFYLFFFTQSLPIFWEAHQFHATFAQQTWTSLFWQTISLSGNVFEKAEPAYGLYFKTIFAFTHHDFDGFRLAKIIVFTITTLLLFKISNHLFSDRKMAMLSTLLAMLSFPVYIHTMIPDEAFIIAEMWKFACIFVFLKDINKPTTSLANHVLIVICALFAFKTYPPAASATGLLIAFTLLRRKTQFKRYAIIFALLFIMIFPFSSITNGKTSGPFGIVWENIPAVFFTNLARTITSPFASLDFSDYTFRALYWKPLPDLITFFGIWALVISIITMRFYREQTPNLPWTSRDITWFSTIWMIVELPLFISVPEPAIRYASAFITPFSLFFIHSLYRAHHHAPAKFSLHAKYAIYFIVLFMMSTNIFNTFYFRALLGSDVIAMNKVSQIIEREKNSCIIYLPTYLADQYLLVDTTNNQYNLRTDLTRIKATGKEQFQKIYFEKTKPNCSHLFIVQQKSITRGTLFPPIDFTQQKNMRLVKRVIGRENTLFDAFVSFLTKTFAIKNLYNEYNLWEYRDS